MPSKFHLFVRLSFTIYARSSPALCFYTMLTLLKFTQRVQSFVFLLKLKKLKRIICPLTSSTWRRLPKSNISTRDNFWISVPVLAIRTFLLELDEDAMVYLLKEAKSPARSHRQKAHSFSETRYGSTASSNETSPLLAGVAGGRPTVLRTRSQSELRSVVRDVLDGKWLIILEKFNLTDSWIRCARISLVFLKTGVSVSKKWSGYDRAM